LALLGLGTAVFLVSLLLSKMPNLVEGTYGTRVGPAISCTLSRITGVLPFSLAEWLIAAFVTRQVVGLGRGLADALRRRRRWKNALGGGALRAGQDAGIVVALFYLLWGFQYARPSVEARLDWPDGGDAPVEVIAELAAEMVDAANDAYVALHGSDDAGEPTRLPDPSALDVTLEEGWRAAAREMEMSGPAAGRFGRAKRLLASGLLDRLGLSGFYFPFTGEANVNRGVPAVSYPQVVAHEKAHQRGINPEDEANFFGFLAAALTPDPYARYSACVFAQRQLLFTLLTGDEERAKHLIERRHPGVQRDVDDLRAYWQRYRGPAQRISRAVNDAYLRTNRVEGGILSYGRSVELLVAYSRSRGGRLN
jgi:hypothetical protein